MQIKYMERPQNYTKSLTILLNFKKKKSINYITRILNNNN